MAAPKEGERYVHSNGQDHRQVDDESEQGIVDGVVKKQVMSEFVAGQIQGVVECASDDVPNEYYYPP